MATKTLSVVITGNASGAQSAFKEVEAGTTGVETKTKSMGASLLKVGAALGAVSFFKGVFAQSQEAERTMHQVEAVIKSTGGVAHVTAKDVGELADTMARKTGIDRESIAHGEAVMLTFTHIRNEVGKGNDVFNRATKDALDMSAALGIPLQGAVTKLGKALNDPIKGLGALGKAGVTFTSQQKEMITSLVNTGHGLEAQKIILGAVEERYKGAAVANATAMDKAKESFKQLQRSVGEALAPALDAAGKGLGSLATAFTGLPKGVQAGTIGVVGFGAAVLFLAPKITSAIETIGKLAKSASELGPKLASMGPAVLGIAAAIGVAVYAYKDWNKEAEQVKTHTKSLIDAADATGKSIKTLAVEDMTKAVSGSKVLQTAVDGTTGGMKGLASALTGSRAGWRSYLDNLKESMTAQGTAKPLIEAVGKGLDDQRAAALKAGEAHSNLKRDTKALADGTAGLTGSSKAQAAAADAQAKANDALAKAIDNARKATKAEFDAQLDSLNLDAASAGAKQALTDAWTKNGFSIDVNTAAGRDNIGMLEAARTAALAQAQAVQTSSGSAAQGAISMLNYATGLAMTAKQAGMSQSDIGRMIGTMHLTPADIMTAFHVSLPDIANAQAQIAAAAQDRHFTIYANVQVQGAIDAGILGKMAGMRAGGGPVTAGQPYIVGEHRAELFVPNQNGTIIPQVSMSNGGSTRGGDTFIVQGSILAERDLVDVIARARRRGLIPA